MAVLATLLGGCVAVQSQSPAADPDATDPETVLPAAEAFLPLDVAASTPWMRMAGQPSGFALDAPHASVAELADAFGAAIVASFAQGGDPPQLGLEVVDETEDRALLLVSETGAGDDSVAGTQYALVVTRASDGWRVAELWTRAFCWRGASGDLCV